MNRRGFFGALVGLVAAGSVVPAAQPLGEETYAYNYMFVAASGKELFGKVTDRRFYERQHDHNCGNITDGNGCDCGAAWSEVWP